MSNQYFTALEDSAKQFSMLNTSNSNVANTLTTNNTTVTTIATLSGALIFPNSTVLTAAEILNAAAYTLKTSDSGKLYILPKTTGASLINLPTPVDNAGVNFKFMFGVADPLAAGGITIKSNDANIVGYILDLAINSPNTKNAISSAVQNIVVSDGTTAEQLNLYIYSDGTLYHLQGSVTQSGATNPVTLN